MSTAPRITVALKTAEAACVAYLPMSGPYAQIPAAFARLYAWIAGQGLAPVGMPSGVYLTDPAEGEEHARWELRAPVAGDRADAPIDASGCGIKHLGARLVAAATYRGPYGGIAPAYDELAAWILTSDYVLGGPPEELYCSEPATPPDETLTEIRFPVERG